MRNKRVAQTPPEFFVWLDETLRALDWNDQQLAIKAKISHSAISKARSNTQPLGYDVCREIAKAVGVDEVFVLRLAGHLEKPRQANLEDDQLMATFRSMNDDDRRNLLEIATVMLFRKQRTAEKGVKNAKTKTVG